MSELIINELLNTLPFFILGYLPMKDHLRYSLRRSAVILLIGEFVYLCLFALLITAGLPSVWVQYMAVPVFIAMMLSLIFADKGIIIFHFIFTLDYLLVIRASTFLICQNITGFDFYSWRAGVLSLLLTLATVFVMSRFSGTILKDLMAVQIPEYWKTAWLLPFAATTMILLLTGTIRSGSVNSLALLSRILLLICMFLISHLMIMFIRNIQEQIISNERNKTMENLLRVQREQYEMLQSRINENRRARHDFRHHRAVIRDMVSRGDLDALRQYIDEYDSKLTETKGRNYSSNLIVNALLSFYADNAEKLGIKFSTSIKLPDKLLIPDTEFCVLLGNLLENAVDACKKEKASVTPASNLVIRVLIMQNGVSNLTVAVDNSCSNMPVWKDEELISSKHKGSGIGTESIRYIARLYNGEARFEWHDGIFYASVMLNPLCSDSDSSLSG